MAGSRTVVLPFAKSPARSSALFTCALAMGKSCRAPLSFTPWIFTGAVSFGPSATMFAPILRSGAMTRSIGRPESVAPPTSRLSKLWPARSPASNRMVVAEFPQSISPAGAVSKRFLPCTTSMSGSGCSILIPSARSAWTVRRQSSLGRNPRRTQTPFESAPMMTARCEMLLSPGTAISASMRGARLMRNSMRLY